MFARVLLGCVALCGLSFVAVAEEPKETKLKPTALFYGTHSAIQDEKFAVVSNEKEWKKLWEAHRGDGNVRLFSERDQTFDIDFDTHYIAALFIGDYPDGKFTPRQRGDVVAIGYKGLLYQTEGRVARTGVWDRRSDLAKAKEATTSIYAFVVLPKPVKTVVIEKDVQNELGKPPIWEEQKRFPAPKDKK